MLALIALGKDWWDGRRDTPPMRGGPLTVEDRTGRSDAKEDEIGSGYEELAFTVGAIRRATPAPIADFWTDVVRGSDVEHTVGANVPEPPSVESLIRYQRSEYEAHKDADSIKKNRAESAESRGNVDASRTARGLEPLAPCPLDALSVTWFAAASAFARDFLAQPHRSLGRRGSVCPFVPKALERDTLRVLVFSRGGTPPGEAARSGDASAPTPSEIVEAARHLGDLHEASERNRNSPPPSPASSLSFSSLFPSSPPSSRAAKNSANTRPSFRAVVALFPEVHPRDAASTIDAAQAQLKPLFVERGLMIGEFHASNETKGLRAKDVPIVVQGDEKGHREPRSDEDASKEGVDGRNRAAERVGSCPIAHGRGENGQELSREEGSGAGGKGRGGCPFGVDAATRSFYPLRCPVPALAVRSMVESDVVFMETERQLDAFVRIFGEDAKGVATARERIRRLSSPTETPLD